MAINAKTQTPIQMVILTGSSITFMMPTFSNRNGTTLAVRQLLGWCWWHGCFFLRLCFRGRGDGAALAPRSELGDALSEDVLRVALGSGGALAGFLVGLHECGACSLDVAVCHGVRTAAKQLDCKTQKLASSRAAWQGLRGTDGTNAQ